jgi:hypothetical protein
MSSTIQYPGKNPGSKFFSTEANEIKTVVNAHVDELPLRWFSGQTYAIDEIVEYGGILYKSLQGSNVNQQPDTEVAYWEEVKTGGGATLEGLMGETSGVAGKVYYRAGDQKFYLADVTDETKRNIIGVLQESVALDEEAVLSLVGTIEDLTGLVDGQEYYLGEAGALVQRNSIPSGAPVIFIGRGNGTTKLDVNVEAYLESPQTVLRRDLGEMFTSYSSSVPAGALGFDYDNAVSIGAYQSLFDLVGHAFNADHVAAGEADLSGSSVSFYPTPTPGKYPRAAKRPYSLTNSDFIDSSTFLSWNCGATIYDRFRAGEAIKVKLSSGTMPTGLTDGQVYYVNKDISNVLLFCTTEADAISNSSQISYTDSGSGTFQIEQVGIALDDAFQSHAHTVESYAPASSNQVSGNTVGVTSSGALSGNARFRATDPIEETGYGTPRTTNETRPVTDYVYYYIQAREAANIGPDAYSVPLGDFNISTTGASVDLDSLAGYPNGTVFNVSWYGGVGTAQFSFTGTGYTLNDIDPTSSENWKGDGTGRLQFEKFSTTAFYTLDCGEVWDSDGNNFTDNFIFYKFLNGKANAGYSNLSGLTAGSENQFIFPINIFTEPQYNISVALATAPISSANDTSVCWFDVVAGDNSIKIRTDVAGSNEYSPMAIGGKWTTDTPREISRRSPILFSKGLKEFDPVPLGDFNIATSAASVDLDDLAGYDIGTKFKVSWYGGDGTAKLTFGGTGVTLNGIDPTSGTNWNGDGTGFLKFEKTGAGTFVIVDTPDIWDSREEDNSGTYQRIYVFKKFLDGTQFNSIIERKDNGGTGSESFNQPLDLVAYRSSQITMIRSTTSINVQFDVSASDPTTMLSSFAVDIRGENGVAVSTDCNFAAEFTGLWTTDAPRRT